jgi:hypothetical protein
MRRLCAVIFLVGTLVPVSSGLGAQVAAANQPYPDQGQQTPPPARPSQTPPPTPEAAMPPRAPSLPTANPANVKLDLTITDTYTGTPVKKTVSLLILNGSSGMIRTSNRLASGSNVGLNIDAAAVIQQGGLITVRVTFEYTPAQSPIATLGGGTREQTETAIKQLTERGLSPSSQPAELHESISVILQDGKPLLVSQSADPTTDRKVTVELMATVLK